MQSFRENFFKKKFTDNEGIIRFDITDKVTKNVTDFYTVNPFPHYAENEDKNSILIKGDKNLLAKKFKNFSGFKKNILEVGSGTSQLSIYLSIGTNNEIFAFDPTLQSLKLGKDFAKNNNIKNVNFINADIFDDVLESNIFDLIWCNGVLHHTKNPEEAFKIILNSLKKNGYILLGLYNRIGRIRTIVRKYLYRIFGKSYLFIFDPVLRNIKKDSKNQIDSWIRDQYHHPVESLHTFDEILKWFEKYDIEFINSIPSCDFISKEENFFEKSNKETFLDRILSQIFMIFSRIGSDGGLFVMIGRKK